MTLRRRRDQLRRVGSRYDAFISYSHEVDGAFAPELQAALERFAKPWYRARSVRIFIDDVDLSATPHLWTEIRRVLDSATFFILLASPAAARSKWVNRELAHWREHCDPRHVLVAVTRGEVAWNEERADFDLSHPTNPLPPALSGLFDEEPKYADLRDARAAEPLVPSEPQFADAVATLAAALSGRSKAELVSEAARQRRRVLRVVRSVATVLVVLTGAATVFGVLALHARNAARAAARLAVSRALAAESASLFDADPATGALLSLESYRLDPTGEARSAMVSAFERDDRALAEFDVPDAAADVAFGPDDRTVAAAGFRNEVVLLDVQTGRVTARLRGRTGSTINSVAFGHDGRTIVAGENGAVEVWQLPKRTPVRVLATTGRLAVESVAFSADGRVFASGGVDGKVRVWDTRDLTLLASFRSARTHAVALDPHGAIVCAAEGGAVRSWTVATRAPRPLIRTKVMVTAVGFSPDGSLLASGDANGDVWLWDTATSRLRGRLRGTPLKAFQKNPVSDLAFTPDGSLLATAGEDSFRVRLWDLPHRRPYGRTLPLAPGGATSVSFSPDGRFLAAAAGGSTILLYDSRRVPHADVLTPPAKGKTVPGIDSIVFSPDGRILATGGGGNSTIELWRVSDRRLVKTLRTQDGVGSMTFTPDGRTLAVGGNDGSIRLWSVGSRRPSARTVAGAPTDEVSALAFSRDGRLLAAGSEDGTLTVWRMADRSRLASARANGGAVRAVAFSADGRDIVSGGYEPAIEVRRLAPKLVLIRTLRGHTGSVETLIFTPDGRELVSAAELNDAFPIRLWRYRDAAPEATLRTTGFVAGLALSADGRTLAAAEGDKGVALWDVRSRLALGTPLVANLGSAVGVAFAPRGTSFAVGYESGNIALWDGIVASVDPRAWEQRLCQAAGHSLTRADWKRYVGTADRYRPCPSRPTLAT